MPPDGMPDLAAIESADLTFERAQPFFMRFYTPPQIEIEARVPPHKLPLKPGEIANWAEASTHFRNKGTAELILANGFAVEEGWGERLGPIEEAYDNLPAGVPAVVTVDAVLHVQHVLYARLYGEIERTFMTADLETLVSAGAAWFEQAHRTHRQTAGTSPKQAAAARRNLAYFTVARCLLDPATEVPGDVEREVRLELRDIASASPAPSPIFIYTIDYGALRQPPTGDAALDRYRTALAWLTAGGFLLEEDRAAGADSGTVDIQTIQAVQIAQMLGTNRAVYDAWQRLHALLEFFGGAVNDVSVGDVVRAKAAVDDKLAAAGGSEAVGEAAYLALVRRCLLSIPRPALLDAFAGSDATPGGRAVRLFGQRVCLDTRAMDALRGLRYLGDGRPFTRAEAPMGPIRGFATGLDVMAALGSARAETILRESGDAGYAFYDRRLGEIRGAFGRLGDADWRSGLAAWRLGQVRMLLAGEGAGTPAAQTDAAQGRNVLTGLAAWVETRHDAPADAPPLSLALNSAPGRPEQAPRFFVEMKALNDALRAALESLFADHVEKLGIEERTDDGVFVRLENVIPQLPTYDSTRLFGLWLQDLAAPWNKEPQEPMADTPQEPNVLVPTVNEDDAARRMGEARCALVELGPPSRDGQVVQDATGRFNLLWMVYQLPDGTKVLGAGPVMSYYEFKQPMDARFSDEDWREVLTQGEVPDPPAWTKSSLTRVPETAPER
jgi:hypothetical protein